MAFIPKEDEPPRRGVAMQVRQLPNPNVKIGEFRDSMIDTEAKKFVNGTFYLNTAMDASPPPPSKVKTFREGIANPNLNGNITAHCPPEVVHEMNEKAKSPPRHCRAAGERIPPHAIDKFYYGKQREQQRDYEAESMHRAHGFGDRFSPQRGARPGMRIFEDKPAAPQHAVPGFPGLGQRVFKKDGGKKMGGGAQDVFDPLGMRAGKPRVEGMKRVPQANVSTVGEAFKYDDGLGFSERGPKRKNAHRHTFPVTQTQDIDGLRGVGSSDVPAPAHGRKHNSLQPLDHHYENMDRLRSSMEQQHQQQGSSLSLNSGVYYSQTPEPMGVDFSSSAYQNSMIASAKRWEPSPKKVPPPPRY